MEPCRYSIGVIGWLLITLSACIGPGAGGQAAPPSQPAGGHELDSGARGLVLPLRLELSGGFAGRRESLEIAADGSSTWTELRGQTSRRGKLAISENEQLRALLEEVSRVENDQGEQRSPGRCRDCYEYQLILASRGKPLKVVVSSDRLDASAYRELIVLLLTIVDDVKREGR